jgi:hypothetical protein
MGNLITMCVSDEADNTAGAKPVEQVQTLSLIHCVQSSLLAACASVHKALLFRLELPTAILRGLIRANGHSLA